MKGVLYEDQLFRLKQVAEILAISPTMVRTHIASGALPAIKTGKSKGYRISGASIRQFIEANQIT